MLIKFGPGNPGLRYDGLDLFEPGPMYALLSCGKLGELSCLLAFMFITQTQNKLPTPTLKKKKKKTKQNKSKTKQ